MHPCLEAALATPSKSNLDIMRLSVVDWLSVGLAGQGEAVSKIVRDMALAEGGTAQAHLFGGGQAPMRAAALVNGTVSHALDYDDTHFAHIGHPSVAVLPAAMALAQYTDASVDQMVRAALAGCEASIRFGLLFGRGHYQSGFHQTATAGAFGATVAAIHVLKSDPALTETALSLVSTRASGLKAQFGTMGKPYNAGIAASNGVEAALLVTAGFKTSDTAIQGPSGFLKTHHCDGDISNAPGFLMDQISHKYHACCHGLHATLEALGFLPAIAPDAVTHIRVKTHPRWMGVCDKPAPTTGLEAKFSYAGVVSARLTGLDTARLETFADNIWSQGKLSALQDKVQVQADDGLSEMQAAVEVSTADDTHTARYDLARPESYQYRARRIRSKSEALIGSARANQVWQVVHDPEANMQAFAGLLAERPS